jgi:hypothetical protein
MGTIDENSQRRKSHATVPLTSVPDPKYFGTDPDPELNIRALRFRFQNLTCFQNVWRALVSCKFLTYTKTYTVLLV